MKIKAWISVVLLAVLLGGCAGTQHRPQPVGEPSMARRAAMVNVQLGTGYIQQGKPDMAMNKLQKALQQDDSYAPAHHAIAYLYESLGVNDKAEYHYKRAVSLDPNDSDAHNTFGTFLCKQGKLDKADDQFMAALKNPLYKTPEFSYTNAGICAMRMPDYPKAEGYLRQALEINKRFPSALYQMSELKFATKDYMTARAYIERYASAAQHNAATLWLGYRIERELGDQRTADHYAAKLRRDFPDADETKQLLGVNKP